MKNNSNKPNIKYAIDTSEPIKPVQISYSNTSDRVKKVNAFETFSPNKEEGISLQFSQHYCKDMSMEFFHKYFYENPHLSTLIRVQCETLMGKQSQSVFYIVNKNPMGEVLKSPAFIPLDVINKGQFQSGILDVPYSFLLDGLTSDLEFDLMPNTTLVITLYFSHKCVGRSKKSLSELNEIREENNNKNFNFKYVGSFVIENNYDVEREIILLDVDKYKNEYTIDPNLKVYDLFSFNYQDMCDLYSNRTEYFNSIRIYSNSGKSNMKQIMTPIEFNSGNKYYPAIEIDGSEFQSYINDINIIGEELTSTNTIKVTVLPKSTVVYLLKQYHDRINTSTTTSSFYNISIENKSEDKKTVNVIDVFDDIKGNEVLHKIGKNKLSVSGDKFSSDIMRVIFYNIEQIERPIMVKSSNAHGGYSLPIFPVCHINENDFSANMVNIEMDSVKLDKSTEVLFDLDKSGDGANIIFGKKHKSYLSNKKNSKNLFPIWFENNTDETQTIVLENDILNYNDLPKGVTCKAFIDSSYRELLDRFQMQGNYNKMILNKIYSKNTSQIFQEINMEDYTNPESIVTSLLRTLNYFSANQFKSEIITINGHIGVELFDLSRIAGENEIKKDGDGNEYNCPISVSSKKQRISFNILPKTKLALICSLEKK